MARDLRNRVIIITGASAGIGAATALACARAGMHVALAARRQDRLVSLARKIEELGVTALPLTCDVRQRRDVQQLVARTIEKFGRLHAIYANAGYALYSSILDTSEEAGRDLFETNFWGTIYLIQEAMAALRETATREKIRSHVVICSSTVSEVGLPMYGFYSATKAAQDSIAGAMRAELYREPIDVSTVHPVGTRTELFDVAARISPQGKGWITNTPDLFMQNPEKVAARIVACLQRPRPEVWPSPAARFGVAFATAFPRIAAWGLRRMMRFRKEH